MNNLVLSQRKKACGVDSIIFTIAGLLWFVVCFTAKEPKWWNSLWFFLLIFVSSVSLGVIGRKSKGGILGIIVGLLISFNLNTIADIIYNLSGFKVFPSDVYVLDKIPSEVNWLTIFFITLATLLTSIVFSLYPAAKAGSLSPLEALRHE